MLYSIFLELYIMPKIIRFKDYPEFKPNLTPYEIFRRGSFGGTYWRPIYSSITDKNYENMHKKYKWSKKLSDDIMTRECRDYDKNLNKYKVKVGGYKQKDNCGLEDWEERGWITKNHPYGWVQWYCEFYEGKRSEDDEWQISRWMGVAGPKGRFLKRYKNLKKKGLSNKERKMKVLLQILQHWAKAP